MTRTRCAYLFMTVAMLAACDASAPASVEVANVDLLDVEALIPGRTVTLRGTALRGLKELRIDGDSIARNVVPLSDSVATFSMPVLRRCETDGRPVTLVANGRDTLRTRLTVPEVVTMFVGESRVMRLAAGACVVLPARNQDYVISAANLELPIDALEQSRKLLSLRSWTDDPPTVFAAPAQSAARMHVERHPPLEFSTARAAQFSTQATLFDSRYATAQPGDTVTMVAWAITESGDRAICALPRDRVPTYKAVVIAAAGRIAVLADLRVAATQQFLAPGGSEWVQRAAEAADAVLVPTMKAVFDRDFEPHPVAGGRYLALMGALPNDAAGYAMDGRLPGGTWAAQAGCAHASEVVTTVLGANFWLHPLVQRDVAGLASVILHEYAHIVDMRAHVNAGRSIVASRPFVEAWAVNAEETAVRIAIGQSLGASPPRKRGFNFTHSITALDGMWGALSGAGPWQSVGAQTVSAQMLLFAREFAGEASVQHNARPSLYQRVTTNGPASADRVEGARALARTLDVPLDSLVDMYALASVTAGLIEPHVYTTTTLPRFRSWDLSSIVYDDGPLATEFKGSVPRFGSRFVELLAASGSFGAAYMMGDGARGISIEVLEVGTAPHVIRLTRLR